MNLLRIARPLTAATLVLALSGAGIAAESANKGPANSAAAGKHERDAGQQREYIYGAELMTPLERERYRTRLRKAQGEGREDAERDGHRRQIRERARQQGITLEEPAGVLRSPERPR